MLKLLLKIIKYTFRIQENSDVGCENDENSGSGGWAVTKFYYKKNVTTFFGPICKDGFVKSKKY